MSKISIISAGVLGGGGRPPPPEAMVVVAAEPMETLTDLVAFTTLFPRQRVAGVGGVIDSARLRALLGAG